MHLSNELEKAQDFVGQDDLTNYKIVWLQQTNEEHEEFDFIEEVEDDDEIVEDEGFESLYNLIIACAESFPRLVKLIRKSSNESIIIFDQNNNSMRD